MHRNWEKVAGLLTLDKRADTYKKGIKLDSSFKMIEIQGKSTELWFVVHTAENAEYSKKNWAYDVED